MVLRDHAPITVELGKASYHSFEIVRGLANSQRVESLLLCNYSSRLNLKSD